MKKKSEKKTGKVNAARQEEYVDSGHVKFAVSMPPSDFEMMEAVRKKLSMSRSRFVVLAARRWFDDLEEKRLILAYTKGYELLPEDANMLTVMEELQSQQLAEESW